MGSLAIVLNSTNNINALTNTTFKYDFVQGALAIPDKSTITIANIMMPYAFFNVSRYYSNKTFSIRWWDASVVSITLDDGFYTISDVNNFLITQFIAAGKYLLDSTGNYVVYASFSLNPTYYAVMFNSYAFPTSLPAGYTNPSGLLFPATASTPQLLITSNISNMFGLNQSVYYPPAIQATNYSVLSTSTPVGSTINSIVCRCSLVDNNASLPSDILGSFPINASFGDNITYTPSFEIKLTLKKGRFTALVLSFFDQNLNAIYSQDANIQATLLLNLGN